MLYAEYSDLVFLKGRLCSVVPTPPSEVVRTPVRFFGAAGFWAGTRNEPLAAHNYTKMRKLHNYEYSHAFFYSALPGIGPTKSCKGEGLADACGCSAVLQRR